MPVRPYDLSDLHRETRRGDPRDRARVQERRPGVGAGRRGGFRGVGGGARAGIPAPVLSVRTEDFTWSGTDLDTAPSRIGPAGTIPDGVPTQGDVRNGKQGVRFTKTAHDMIKYDPVSATVGEWTLIVAYHPLAADGASGDRSYLGNYDDGAAIRAVFADRGNSASGHFSERGIFHNGAWSFYSLTNYAATQSNTFCVARPHVAAWGHGASGSYHQIDGDVKGRIATGGTFALPHLVIGGSERDTTPFPTGFDGHAWAWDLYNVKLSEADCRAASLALRDELAIPEDTLVADLQAALGANLVCLFDADDIFYVEYTAARAITTIRDRTGTHTAITGALTIPVYRSSALSGRGCIRHVAGNGLICDTIAQYDTGLPGPRHKFALVRDASGADSANGYLLASGSSADNTAVDVLIQKRTATAAARAFRSTSAAATRSALSADPGDTFNFLISSQDETGDTSAIDLNGTLTAGTTTNLASQALDRGAIGYQRGLGNNNSGFGGDWRAMGIITGALTAQQRADLRAIAQAAGCV